MKRRLLKDRGVRLSACSAGWCARGISSGAAFVLALLAASCIETVDVMPETASPAVPSTAAEAAPLDATFWQNGTAAWYGKELQGRRTASGDLFDSHGLSAAHRTLPLGSMIRVTNLQNDRKVTVRVNDRGPFVNSRVLDLSYEAARTLEFAAEGTAQVMIERLDDLPGTASFTVHAAQYVEEENARLLKERLSSKFEVISIVTGTTNLGTLYHVEVGVYPTEEKAETVAGRVAREGLEPVVIRKDH